MDNAQRARAMTALTLLEGRRQELAGAMWQAPSLTFVAQAFLLGVLTRETVGWAVAIPIATAGVIATLTAMYALVLLRDREVHFGERVKSLALTLGLGDPQPHEPTERRARAGVEGLGAVGNRAGRLHRRRRPRVVLHGPLTSSGLSERERSGAISIPWPK